MEDYQEAHLCFAYSLEIASMWLSETGRCSEIQDGSGKCGSRGCGVIAQCVVYLQCQ